MSLAVVAVLRNQAPLLRAWALHYIAQGARLYIVNHDSQDNWYAQLEGLWQHVVIYETPQVKLDDIVANVKADRCTWLLFSSLHEGVAVRDGQARQLTQLTLLDYCRETLGTEPGQASAIRLLDETTGQMRSLVLVEKIMTVDFDASVIRGEARLDNGQLEIKRLA